MNETQREQIRDTAKYLREVRPIDPEEIHEYVEGSPHPAAVRQVLREQATVLALVEREDGRFEPASDEPVTVQVHGVKSMPEDLSRAIEGLLVERFGPGWPDGESGEMLRTAIRDFKQRYLTGATVTYDEVTALGYALYHVPAYFAGMQYVVSDLTEDGLIPGHLRVLDVGAGVGGPALGLESLLPAETLVEYHAIEPSDAADVLSELLETTGRNFHTTVHRSRIESVDPSTVLERDEQEKATEGFDLVVLGNVLSELDDPGEVLADAMDWLAPDGTVVALAPADKVTATDLRKAERIAERETGATIYAPTIRLWPNEYPESESWSFRSHPDLETPSFQRKLDEGNRTPEESRAEPNIDDDAEGQPAGSGEFCNVDVQYAYSLLRRDGKTAVSVRPDRSRVAKLRETERHVTDRIDCLAIKLSHDLSEGENPLYLIGDGSQQLDHFAVLTKETSLNSDLANAEYGEAVLFESVLVLWNDDEGAYNLVVDEETIVDRIPE